MYCSPYSLSFPVLKSMQPQFQRYFCLRRQKCPGGKTGLRRFSNTGETEHRPTRSRLPKAKRAGPV